MTIKNSCLKNSCQARLLYAVIIAGGQGKRFWPESRLRMPKYLLRMPGQKNTLLQQAVSRLKGLVQNKNIIVVTNRLQYASTRRQLPRIDKKNIIAEPLMKNTAAAAGLAATIISKKDPDGIMVVLPADQLIPDKYIRKFKAALKNAADVAMLKDALVTIGIKPTSASTGFGYIKVGERLKRNIFKADKFIEKPNLEKAKAFIKMRNYFWNSGIFIMKASVILKEIERYMPTLASGLSRLSLDNLKSAYKKFPDISIDYGIMEKSKKVYVIKADLRWYDIGSWGSLSEVIKPGPKCNIVIGPHLGTDTKNSIIIGKRGHLIGTIGLRDVIVIHTDDATLICRKDKSELVKELVNGIEREKGFRKFL